MNSKKVGFVLGTYVFEEDYNVVEEAERIILESSKKYDYLFVNYSGGKESNILSDIIFRLVEQGKLDPKKLEFSFIDEEAMYPCIIEIVEQQYHKAISLGIKFNWFCLELKHYSCLHQLENSESFILWEKGKEDVWVRQPPEFAIREHPLANKSLRYQQFLDLYRAQYKCNYGCLIGLRMNESLQRKMVILKAINNQDNSSNLIYPLLNFSLNDVWLYHKVYKVPLAQCYLNMYSIGTSVNMLRVSQFFALDTFRALVHITKFYTGLYDKVLAREPEAQLAAIYHNTSMFAPRLKTNVDIDEESNKNELKKLSYIEVRDKAIYEFINKKVQKISLCGSGSYLDNHILFYLLMDLDETNIIHDVYNICYNRDLKARRYRSLRISYIKGVSDEFNSIKHIKSSIEYKNRRAFLIKAK